LRKTFALLLAAGLGTRLRPYTEHWPKCLMPIQGHPLLEYWLSALQKVKINDVLVNTHYHADIVLDFLQRESFAGWVKSVYEKDLLGTAGTLRANIDYFEDNTVLFAHADNLCCCDFSEFLDFHYNARPEGTVMTMMTFATSTPSTCGIVEINDDGVVTGFYEKVANPPGNLANAAVYLIEPVLIQWLANNKEISDFSTEVIPEFMGKIATWKNDNVLVDIGTIDSLTKAQKLNCPIPSWPHDEWQNRFTKNQIHDQICR
jgi:mannose-1-phosphate guanylyltransferase